MKCIIPLLFSLSLSLSSCSSSNDISNTNTNNGTHSNDSSTTTVTVNTNNLAAGASPLPDALKSLATANDILSYDLNRRQLFTVRADGSNLQYLPSTIAGPIKPLWLNAQNIAFHRTVNEPQTLPTLPVFPSVGAQVLQYNIGNNTEQSLFFMVGSPGEYYGEFSTQNRAAVDVIVEKLAWDTPRNRTVREYCIARNHYISGYIDLPDCHLDIVNSGNGNPLVAAWSGRNLSVSKNGNIAFSNYSGGGEYLTDGSFALNSAVHITDTQATASSIVYTAPFGYLYQLEWAPDATHIAWSDKGHTRNDQISANQTLGLINSATGQRTAQLQVTAGRLGFGLSWSPDSRFVLYDIERGGSSEVWWWEPASGQTGPLINTVSANWGMWRK